MKTDSVREVVGPATDVALRLCALATRGQMLVPTKLARIRPGVGAARQLRRGFSNPSVPPIKVFVSVSLQRSTA